MSGLRLHLGCGKRYLPGWVHVDVVPYEHVDYVHTIEQLDLFGDNTFSLLYNCHVLEHVPRRRTLAVLREWHRVLKPGGVLRTAVPDFAALAQLYLLLRRDAAPPVRDFHNNPLGLALSKVIGPTIGGQKSDLYDFHYSLFDEETLRLQLEAVGFHNVRRYDRWATDHADVDDFSASTFPHMGGPHAMLLSLNVEATKK